MRNGFLDTNFDTKNGFLYSIRNTRYRADDVQVRYFNINFVSFEFLFSFFFSLSHFLSFTQTHTHTFYIVSSSPSPSLSFFRIDEQ